MKANSKQNPYSEQKVFTQNRRYLARVYIVRIEIIFFYKICACECPQIRLLCKFTLVQIEIRMKDLDEKGHSMKDTVFEFSNIGFKILPNFLN